MKSPFPGMDPYLEKYWHEVHQRLINLNYRADPNPPLETADAAWADELLRGNGLR